MIVDIYDDEVQGTLYVANLGFEWLLYYNITLGFASTFVYYLVDIIVYASLSFQVVWKVPWI